MIHAPKEGVASVATSHTIPDRRIGRVGAQILRGPIILKNKPSDFR